VPAAPRAGRPAVSASGRRVRAGGAQGSVLRGPPWRRMWLAGVAARAHNAMLAAVRSRAQRGAPWMWGGADKRGAGRCGAVRASHARGAPCPRRRGRAAGSHPTAGCRRRRRLGFGRVVGIRRRGAAPLRKSGKMMPRVNSRARRRRDRPPPPPPGEPPPPPRRCARRSTSSSSYARAGRGVGGDGGEAPHARTVKLDAQPLRRASALSRASLPRPAFRFARHGPARLRGPVSPRLCPTISSPLITRRAVRRVVRERPYHFVVRIRL
jgi:hypothetical protein